MAFKDVTKDEKPENWFFLSSKLYSVQDHENKGARWDLWIIVDRENRKIQVGDKVIWSTTLNTDPEGICKVDERPYQVELVPMNTPSNALTALYTPKGQRNDDPKRE